MRIFTSTPAHQPSFKTESEKKTLQSKSNSKTEQTDERAYTNAGVFFSSLKQLQMDNLSEAPFNQLHSHRRALTPVDD